MDKARTKPGSRVLRKGRSSIPGQPYLVTTTCHQRKTLFADWPNASTASAALAEPRLWHGSHLLCWVLMPDHLHALITLADGESLSRLMQRVKAVTARAVNQQGACNQNVWAPGFHDRAMRKEDDIVAAARYIVANPLRAGLVTSVADYPFWDAVWLANSPDPV